MGAARIGVACSDPDAILATPVETVRRDRSGKHLRRLAALAAELEAVEVIVGLPRTLLGGPHPRLPQRSLSTDRGEPLVGQPHRRRRNTACQRLGQFDCVLGRAADAVGQRAREPDDHLDRLQLGGQRSQPAQVLAGTIAAMAGTQEGSDA